MWFNALVIEFNKWIFLNLFKKMAKEFNYERGGGVGGLDENKCKG